MLSRRPPLPRSSVLLKRFAYNPRMPFALLLALAAIAGATLLTYLYERDAGLSARLCVGVCTGFAALGLVGFVAASVVGLNAASLTVAGALAGLPLLLLSRR